ncbi:hypothetical protein Drorol1_Dr00017843 [Drosera rotundifolia]
MGTFANLPSFNFLHKSPARSICGVVLLWLELFDSTSVMRECLASWIGFVRDACCLGAVGLMRTWFAGGTRDAELIALRRGVVSNLFSRCRGRLLPVFGVVGIVN